MHRKSQYFSGKKIIFILNALLVPWQFHTPTHLTLVPYHQVQVTKDIAISQYSVTIDPLNEKAFPVRENTTDKKARIPVEVSLAAFRQVELLIKRANPKVI